MLLDPSTIYGALVWGVVAGIVTSAVLFIVGLFFTKIFLPWYEALVYQGVDLRGTWNQNFERQHGSFVFHMDLDQNAHRLTGSATMIKSGSADKDYLQPFTIRGSTWEGFVQLTFRSTGRKSLSYASALVKFVERGDSLVGHWAYRGSHTDSVEVEAIHLDSIKVNI